MTLEDRVVTTSILQRFAEETSGALAIPAGLLGRLPADGMHVLVPRGRAPVPGEVLMCEIHLDTGGADPTRMPIHSIRNSSWCCFFGQEGVGE